MSMPIAMVKKRGIARMLIETPQVIDTRHKHFYVGSAWFTQTEEERRANPAPLDACFAHGPNCTVGICVDCWLNHGTRTLQHFYYMPPRKFKPKKKGQKK